MALVVAVIMIVIFLGISGSDSLSKKGTIRRIEDRSALDMGFRQVYTDQKFEGAFIKTIYYPSVDYSKNDLWDELSEVFSNIPSCRDIPKSFLSDLCFTKYNHEYQLVLSVLLAKRGKVAMTNLFCGALFNECEKSIFIRAGESEEDRIWRKRDKDILTWTE